MMGKLKTYCNKKNYVTGRRCLYFLSQFSKLLEGKSEVRCPAFLGQVQLCLQMHNIESHEVKRLKINENYYMDKLKEEVMILFNKHDHEVLLKHDGSIVNFRFNEKILGNIFCNEDQI